MRVDTTAQGISTIILVDTDKQTIYSYVPSQNAATKLNYAQAPKSVTDTVKTIIADNPTIIGTETVDGKACLVIQYADATMGTVKEWLWIDRGFPVKIESTSPSTGTITVLNTNFDFSDIPDNTFDLPAGVKVNDLGSAFPGGIPTNLPTGIPTNLPSGVPPYNPSNLPPGYPTSLPQGIPTNLPPGYSIPARTP